MTLQEVLTALRNADAAGDTAAAQRLAQIAQSMQGGEAEQRSQQLRQRLIDLQSRKPEVETTFGGNVKEAFKGVVPGAIGLLETAGTGIAALLPEETEKSVRGTIKDVAGAAKKPFEAAPGYEGSTGRQLGEGLGSMLAVAPMALMGPAGIAGGVGVGLAAGAGEARERAERSGATGEQRGTATALGTIPGAFDTAIDMALAAFPGGAGKAIGFIKRALVSGGIEGATEAAQEVAQNAIAKGVYKPDQSLLTGAGEAGAMGAGVGTIASLLLDMAIPGRRRGPSPTQPEAEPKAKTPEQQLLGYTPEPFTPTIMPDGSVITTKAEYDEYQKSKSRAADERAEDRRTSDPLAGLSEGQREMALRGKEAALTEAFTSQEPDLFGELVPKREEVTATDVTQDTATRDVATRDMIDELETADIERMVAQDTANTARAERMKLESAIAELDGQIKAKQEKTTQDKRLELLLPLVESDVKNIPKMFVRALKAEGFANTDLTDRERSLINKAYDVRLAEEPVVAEEAAIEQPKGQAAELEAQVPERKTRREPEQLGFPGMGKLKGKAPQAFSEEELAAQEIVPEAPFTGRSTEAPRSYTSTEPFVTTLTADVLDKTGLPKQSGFYKQLLGMDMADQNQWPAITNIFGKVRLNPNIKPATKQAIERLAMQAFGGMAKQQELFPEGRKGAKKPAKEKPSEPTRGRDKDAGDDRGAARTRAEDRKPVVQKPAAAERPAGTKPTEKPEPAGLGDRGQPVRDAGKREGVEPRALKEEPKAPAKVIPFPTPTYRAATAVDSIGTFRYGDDSRGALVKLNNGKTIEMVFLDAPSSPDLEGWLVAGQNVGTDLQEAARKVLDLDAANPLPEARPEIANLKVRPATFTARREAQLQEEEDIADREVPSAPKKEQPKAEKPKAKPSSDNAYMMAKEMGEADSAIKSLAADAYLNSAEDYSIKRAQRMIKDLEDGKVPELKFGKAGTNGPGTGGKFAKEFYDSLSKDEQAKFRKELQDFLYEEIKSKQYLEKYNAAQELARKEVSDLQESSDLRKELNGVATALHPMVVRMLKDNNLVGALRFVSGQNLGRTSEIADRLAGVLGGVDVEVVDLSKKFPGASGMYGTTKDGRRILRLDSDTGLDTWSLLHEGTHAAVNQTLNNSAHPLTKQLTQLFNDVKGSLDTAYGATDVKEFAAEAFSNPAFQRKLAGINPKGEAITAWQRFVHAVKNFLRGMVGLPSKGMGTALDSADVVIEAIVNGHPGTSASLETVSLLNKGSDFFAAMGKRAESLPGLNEERVARIDEFFKQSVPGMVKNVVRQSLPLNALVEVAQKYIPMAPKLDVLVGERAGAENKRNQTIEPIIDRVSNWAKSNPNLVDKLNAVIYKSTLDQVDPSKSRSEYVGKTDSSGNRKDTAWDDMQNDWKALGAAGQSVYKQMRDTYKKMYEDVRNVLDTRIDAALEDKGTANKVKAEIYQRLFASGHIEPYFPLTRTGKHWLSYTLDNEFYVEAFETDYQRRKAIEALQKEGAKDMQKFANLNQVNYRKAPATSFVNNVLRTLEANKVDANVTEEVMRLFLNTLPETSFAQGFRRRKGTLGFKHDAVGALRMKSFNLSRQLSNMEYGAKLEKLRQDMKDYVRSQGNQEEAVAMMNELDARIDYAISPQVPMWSKLATSFGFNMTLGFNVSSALVNLSQIPLVVMPYLGGKYGYSSTARALGRATRYFTQSGFNREVEMLVPTDKGEKMMKVRAFPSLDNYDFSKEGAPKHLKTLAEVAGERGQLNRSQTYDILDVGEDTGMMTKINAVSGFVFHHGERMNRQVALIAAYELELERLKKAGKTGKAAEQEAADYAVYVTELTNGGTAAAAAPRIAQSALGKVVFMYKRYGVSMYYMLFKTARDALKSADPDVRKAAMRQIAGIYGSAALMAGVQGIPMFGIAAMIYNLIAKGEDDDDFDTAARKYLGEGVYSGAINALTGLEISGRIGLSDLLFRDSNTRPSDSVMLSLMETMGGPVVGSINRVTRGLQLIGDGNVERGIEQMLPSAFGNAMKSIRYANEGALTLRGDPILGEVGPWNAFAQFFGFAPAEYTRQLEINSDLKSYDRDTLERRTKLLRKYYIAVREGDSAEAADLVQEMLKFSRRHPSAAITGETIKSSMAQHMKTSQEMYHGITLSKSLRPELLQMAAEYDDE